MKLSLRFVFALTILFSFFTKGKSQHQNDLSFDHISIEQGLSQGNVSDIFQDHLGFIWVGTEDGLNMYDGYSFRIFKNHLLDSTSISNNRIYSMIEDGNGDLWVNTNGGLSRYNRESDNFERFLSQQNDKNSLSSNRVHCMLIDSNGKLWVGTDEGLNIYDAKTKTFRKFFHNAKDPTSLRHSSVWALLEDSQKQIWIGTAAGLSLLNNDGKSFTNFFHNQDDPSSLSSSLISTLFEDRNKTLWIGTFDGGLNRKTFSQNIFTHYVHSETNKESLSNNYIYDITEDEAGVLWVGTDNGLCKMNNNGSFHTYSFSQDDERSISSNSVTKLMIDINQRMWIGTRFGGINIYDKNKYAFHNFKHYNFDKNSLSYNNITSFEENDDGNFWVGTDGGGLNYFDRKSNKFSVYTNTLTNKKVLAVKKDRQGGLWIGMWQEGLNYYNPVTKKVKRYLNDPNNQRSLSDNHIFYILEDRAGNIWVATWGNGLNKYNPKTDDFTRYTHDDDNNNSVSRSEIDFLLEDFNGKIWIATSNGLDQFDPITDTFVHFKTGEAKGSLSNNFVSSIFEDSKRRLWVGTYGGLNLFDPKAKTFKAYYEHDGLPSAAIVGIQEDRNNNLWLSTNKGISCFNPENNTFKNFTSEDGLQGNQFNRWASAKLSSGEMLFGGTNGFTLFNPDSIKGNTVKPPVFITGFKVANKVVKVGENQILKKNITLTSEIQLTHLNNVISFEFAALNYLQSEKNQYRYKLEGFQEEWVEAEVGERKATYTNLNPGEYVFRVIASNNAGVWNNEGASIRIIIDPPFWKTWWFITLIVLVCLGCIISFIIVRLRISKKLALHLEEQIRERTAEVTLQKEALEAQTENMQTLNDQMQAQTDFLQEMNVALEGQKEEAERLRKEAETANQAKSTFLATMSHEIRTPMNGVLGMASLLAETSLTTEQKEYTDTIRGSGEALLTVINDILDFSKIESGNLELDSHAFDLRQCIEDVLDIFAAKAAQKRIDLVYQIDNQIPAQIISDSHRLRQILLNLIGNAMKFTEKGEIFVGVDALKMEQGQMELAFHVRDTGIGIPKDKISRLFKAFSQVDSSTTRKYGGTGLGLVISQRLVELMGGSIVVDSEVGVGTSFGFTMKGTVSQESIRQYVNTTLTGNEGKKVLVVDDNATNLTILKTQLEQWKLLPTLASSASQALQILAQDEKFDLIITDMQMPDMDGVQFATSVKANHASLPIILLSSIGDESKKKHPGLFSAVLNKPVKLQQFSRVLLSVFRADGENIPLEEQKTKQILSENFAERYPLRILIAEDNPINQKLINRVLNKLGYKNIEIAQNGLEVIEKFDDHFYDVILMDVQMPEMDGLEATRMIRLKQYHQPVIISMTANAMQGDREECIKAGMDDYVSKPIKLEEVMRVLEKAYVSYQTKVIEVEREKETETEI